jgi:hypothetical protein
MGLPIIAMDEKKGPLGWIYSSALLASMCCFPSVVLVMFGLASASYAAALSDSLYWSAFRWWLYLSTVIFMAYGLYRFFRAEGICTLDDVKRERQRVINTSIFSFTLLIVIYLIWNYVILELVGIAFGIEQWKETAVWPVSLLF